ncbi:hypothetical protein [Sphingomonas sp. 22176]|uniref:hypothetical protein n=1 Tax=Sphingomonas sp. 22176 TaxID=3453884 RepID=UPI003F831252
MKPLYGICFLSFYCALMPSPASAMEWPTKLICTDAIYQGCADDGLCRPPEKEVGAKARWTFDFKENSFDMSGIYEGKIVPNVSGKIVYQHKRTVNPDYELLTILLDTDQMVTFSPKQPADRWTGKAAFWGVMQFAGPGGSTTFWVSCGTNGNGS